MKVNENIKKLYKICLKEEKKIIGLMSGTSLDGLDIALCSFRGNGFNTRVHVENFVTLDYSDEEKCEIRKVFGKTRIDLEQLCVLNAWIGTLHGEMVKKCLQMWNLRSCEVDIIASHGQTVFHAPKSFHKMKLFAGNSTLQIGDGDHIAVKTGIITISDFRQKNVALGGQGAPLAMYGDVFLFSKEGEDRIMLNIGGIANFTYLPGNLNFNEAFATDTGPGNTLLDAFSRKLFNKSCDNEGKLAKSGTIDKELLKAMKRCSFFYETIPKTTRPELFNVEFVEEAMTYSLRENISSYDLMATLTRFTVETISETIINAFDRKCSNSTKECSMNNSTKKIFLSGGGSHNIFLIDQLKDIMKQFSFDTMDILLGTSGGDAKEAVLFATLANECLCGENSNSNRNDASINSNLLVNCSMGKISFPF